MRRCCTPLALALIAALSGCDPSGPLGPVDPQDITITFGVSGGLAGVQLGVVVDGAEGEAQISCGNFCFGVLDGTIIPISARLIIDLARTLDEADVIERGDRDFGSECCDIFDLEIIYERGSESALLEGTQTLWPEELDVAVRDLFALASGRVPLLVALDTDPTDWPGDPVSLGEVTLTGDALVIEVTYGGGCAPHRMDLVAWGGWLESFPVQINVQLTHDDGDDPCDAIVTEARTFDLGPLREAYEDAYGPIGGNRPTVVLRLGAPGSSTPVTVEFQL